MSNKALICSDIVVEYPEFTLRVTFDAQNGEFISIVGPSGCGKSTTLQLISGLIPHTSGEVFLHGEEISTTAVWERNIALVFQDYALFPHLNVEQNVAYSLRYKKLSKKERKERVKTLLELVELTGYNKRKMNTLSGGERQRIAIARALAMEPKLLLLDEPLSALDAKLRSSLRKHIRHIHEQTHITTLYVTHDQQEALSISDRVIVMNNGTIEQMGTPEEVYNNPSSVFVATFMGEGTLLPTTIINQSVQSSYQVVETNEERYSQLFFRPEKVIVHQDRHTQFPEFLPHLRFDNVEVLSREYQGGLYLLTCQWQEYQILAQSTHAITSDTISLGVRLSDIVYFE
ncbi:MAG: ABC transporter ATP-binding protein [Sphaerochaetaceae bacterium]